MDDPWRGFAAELGESGRRSRLADDWARASAPAANLDLRSGGDEEAGQWRRTASHGKYVRRPRLVPVGLVSSSADEGWRTIGRQGDRRAEPVARVTVVGPAIAAVGYYFLRTMGVNTTFLWASVFMFAAGSGLGLTMPTLEVAVQNAVEGKDLGVVTSSVMFSRTLGEGLGVAILGAVLGNELTNRLAGNALDQETTQRLVEAGEETTPSMPSGLSPEATQIVKTALSNSFSVVFLAAMVIMLAGFVVALTLPNADLDEEAPVESETDGEATHSLD